MSKSYRSKSVSSFEIHAGHGRSAYAMRRVSRAVTERLSAEPLGSVCISIVTDAELRYGVEVSPAQARDELALQDLLAQVSVMPLGLQVGVHYARIRADLKRRGTPIGPNDLFIAAHAMALGCTLVTNNVREFERVIGLQLENWAAASG